MSRSREGSRCLAAAGAAVLLLCGCGAGGEPRPANRNEAAPAANDALTAAGARPTAPNAAAPNAAAPAAPELRSAPWSPTGYALSGTEPFWGGSLTQREVRYMVPEDQFGDVIAVTPDYAADREIYGGSYGGRAFVLTLTRGPCSNGMSDHVFAFTATLEVRGETRRGCADPQEAEG